VGLFAHRRYLAQHGVPASFEDILAHHALIGFDADAVAVRSFRQSGLPITREMFAFRSDSDHAQLAALRTGFGIAATQKRIALRDPDLVEVLPGALRYTLEMWLVCHEDLRASRRVRLLYDHLAEALSIYAGELPAQAHEKTGKTRKVRGKKRG
jgi:DNA-binding transcriptional LysR family regulator